MRATPLLCLPLLAACIEPADAQPRPDAGRSFRMVRPAKNLPRRLDPRESARAVLGLLAERDAGTSALVAVLQNASVADAFSRGGLGGFRLTGTMPDGGASLGSLGGGGLGSRGIGAGRGTGAGFGGLRVGGRRDARFDDVTVRGDLPRWAVTSELSRAAVLTHNCLITIGPHGPVDAPVRVVVRPPTTVDDITVDGAPDAVVRCAREALRRMILGPVSAPVEVSGWLRAAASLGP